MTAPVWCADRIGARAIFATSLAKRYSITYYSIDVTKAYNSIRHRFDRVGVVLSGLCAAHCLASIVVLSAFGIGGEFLLAPAIHKWGLAIALVVAAVAIGWGALEHRKAGPFVIAMSGLTFMGGALALPHGVHESVLTMIGVAMVSLGHVLNLRCSHKAGHEA